jgi:hypothetical protein
VSGALSRLGVFPVEAAEARGRLLRAIETAFPVSCEARALGAWNDLDAALVFSTADGAVEASPRLPVLVFHEQVTGSQGERGRVDFAATERLDPRLRGRALHDDGAALARAVPVRDGDTVLASSDGRPLWLVRPTGEHAVARAPRELAEAESLRDLLVEGDFLSLVPLVHFLRTLTAAQAWTRPPLRACFVMDDPNLHWPSYGYFGFGRTAEHARAHGYHVTVATVPLDYWYVNRQAVRVLRDGQDVLSLAVHGNDHVKGELARGSGSVEQLAVAAQALRRMSAFERRHQVPVSHVMVAPHEVCSTEMMHVLARTGFEGLSYGYGVRSPERLIADWEVTDFRDGGLPVLPRRPLHGSREEFVLRGFLDQPFIVTAHHQDLAGGLEPLADLASELDRIGDVQWTSLGAIARSNVATRIEGDVLRVRLFGRAVRVEVPEGIARVVAELPWSHGAPEVETLVVGGGNGAAAPFAGRVTDPFGVAPGRLDLHLVRTDAIDPARVSRRLTSPQALGRRLLTEARDRSLPLVQG